MVCARWQTSYVPTSARDAPRFRLWPDCALGFALNDAIAAMIAMSLYTEMCSMCALCTYPGWGRRFCLPSDLRVYPRNRDCRHGVIGYYQAPLCGKPEPTSIPLTRTQRATAFCEGSDASLEVDKGTAGDVG